MDRSSTDRILPGVVLMLAFCMLAPLLDVSSKLAAEGGVPVGQITTALADAGLNIIDMINKSKGELAYTLVDVDRPVPAEVLGKIRAIAGVLSVRCP